MTEKLEIIAVILALIIAISLFGQWAHRVCVATHPDSLDQCEFPT